MMNETEAKSTQMGIKTVMKSAEIYGLCPESNMALTGLAGAGCVWNKVAERMLDGDVTPENILSVIIAHIPAVRMMWPGSDAFADHAVRNWYRDRQRPPGSEEAQGAGGGMEAAPPGRPKPSADGWQPGRPPGQAPGSGQDGIQESDPGDRPEPMPEPYGEDELPDTFWDLVALMEMGLDVALVGPAGCGKTYMMMEAAEHLGRGCTITTAPQMPYDLAGFVDGHGKRVETAFTEAFTQGKIAGVDEADRASEDALIAIHAPIANRTMYLPGLGQTPAAEGFQVVMTMNTYGLGMDEDYNTAHQLDTATRDRLVFLPVDFDPRIDAEMCGGDEQLFRFVRAWRMAVDEDEATHAVLSYRTAQRLHRLSRSPRFGMVRALETALVKGLPKHTVEGIRSHMDGANPWLAALDVLIGRMRE